MSYPSVLPEGKKERRRTLNNFPPRRPFSRPGLPSATHLALPRTKQVASFGHGRSWVKTSTGFHSWRLSRQCAPKAQRSKCLPLDFLSPTDRWKERPFMAAKRMKEETIPHAEGPRAAKRSARIKMYRFEFHPPQKRQREIKTPLLQHPCQYESGRVAEAHSPVRVAKLASGQSRNMPGRCKEGRCRSIQHSARYAFQLTWLLAIPASVFTPSSLNSMRLGSRNAGLFANWLLAESR